MKYFDLHCDTLFSIAHEGGTLRRRKGHLDLQRAQQFEHYAQVFALFCGSEPLTDAKKAHEMFQRLLRTAQREIADTSDCLLLCRTAADFAKAERQGKTAAFLSIEGAELIQSEEDFCAAVEAGIRIVTLSWNHDSLYACGAKSDQSKGLTAAGKRLVHALERNGIVPDVSHLSERGFWDLMETTDTTVCATHSNSALVCPHPRNLTDEQFGELARRGGLVGLNGYTAFVSSKQRVTMSDLFPHIDHWMELGGEDSLAIGADFDGCNSLPEGMSDICSIAALEEEMRRHGYSEMLLHKLFYDNAARFVREQFIR